MLHKLELDEWIPNGQHSVIMCIEEQSEITSLLANELAKSDFNGAVISDCVVK